MSADAGICARRERVRHVLPIRHADTSSHSTWLSVFVSGHDAKRVVTLREDRRSAGWACPDGDARNGRPAGHIHDLSDNSNWSRACQWSEEFQFAGGWVNGHIGTVRGKGEGRSPGTGIVQSGRQENHCGTINANVVGGLGEDGSAVGAWCDFPARWVAALPFYPVQLIGTDIRESETNTT